MALDAPHTSTTAAHIKRSRGRTNLFSSLTIMAPIAIDESITGSMHIDAEGSVEVEDVIVAGGGPAGLMLAYVYSAKSGTTLY
jgi:NADPH-dependent 2,4-dienoyl-CoA reductase/sulfur reductase-like enzyme